MAAPVRHLPGPPLVSAASKALRKLGPRGNRTLDDLADLYAKHNGASLFVRSDPRNDEPVALLRLLSAEEIDAATANYGSKGDLNWVVDSRWQKTKEVFDSHGTWIAIGQGEGPTTVLILFVSGTHAGQVFHCAPQPRRNVGRALYPSVPEFLRAIGREPAHILHRLGQHVTMLGRDGDCYGLSPVDYLPDARTDPDYSERGPFEKTRRRRGRTAG